MMKVSSHVRSRKRIVALCAAEQVNRRVSFLSRLARLRGKTCGGWGGEAAAGACTPAAANKQVGMSKPGVVMTCSCARPPPHAHT